MIILLKEELVFPCIDLPLHCSFVKICYVYSVAQMKESYIDTVSLGYFCQGHP